MVGNKPQRVQSFEGKSVQQKILNRLLRLSERQSNCLVSNRMEFRLG